MKTIKERAKELLSSGAGEDTIFVAFELLKELVDAPEPEPVAWMVKNGFVCSMIYRSKKDADNYAADQQKRHDLSGSLAGFCVIPLYTAPTPAEPPADVARDVRLQVESEFAAMLPGVTYMDAPEAEPVLVVETEPGYWTRGHYCEGTKSYIDPTKVWGLPAGTKLYTAPPAPSVPNRWRSLTDVEWMNIVNFDRAYSSYDKEEAVNEAVKRTEAKLKELNAAPTPAEAPAEAPADAARDAERYRQQCDKLLAALTEIAELDILKYHHAYAIAKGAIEEIEALK